MSYSKGIMWLDDCRIPFVDEGWVRKYDENSVKDNPYHGVNGSTRDGIVENNTGRFTPNLLVCGDVLNDGSVSKTNTKGQTRSEQRSWNYTSIEEETKMSVIQDKGTNSRYYDLDLWFDKMLEGL